MKWTQELHRAAFDLYNEPVVTDLDRDIQSRAQEYLRVKAGTEFEPHQVQYTHCLLQRLDWHNPRPSHAAFKKAWDDAHA